MLDWDFTSWIFETKPILSVTNTEIKSKNISKSLEGNNVIILIRMYLYVFAFMYTVVCYQFRHINIRFRLLFRGQIPNDYEMIQVL